MNLADLTTLRLGGPADEVVTATTEAELVAAVTEADDAGRPLLLVAGGSNLVVADAGFPGRVVRVATRGVRVEADACSGATITVAAGEPWDALVARAVVEGWLGVEALAGIPGSTGATPIQNVGAYGQEVAHTLARVRTWDRVERRQRTYAAADCGFGYRTSRFKQDPLRHVVLDVTFQLPLGALSGPVGYAELARALDVEPGGGAPAADVRDAVLALRRRKGMVLDATDHDTWSAGSFFTNPVVDAGHVPSGAPSWPQPDGRAKTSAAWLIEQTGLGKGHARGGVAVSTKHSLALTNRGHGTTAELLALAIEIRDEVELRYGIRLLPEPTLVGVRC